MRERGGGGGGAMRSTWRLVTALLLFWGGVLVYMSASLFSGSDVTERTERQLQRAMQELDAIKSQNVQLQNLAAELRDIQSVAGAGAGQDDYERLKRRLYEAQQKLDKVLSEKSETQDMAPLGTWNEPSLRFEVTRRRVENGVQELWFYLRAELHKAADRLKSATAGDATLAEQIDAMLEDTGDMHRVLMADLYNLSMSDGADDWRKKEAEELSDLVQRRLYFLQNPKDCSSAKKLVCNLNKGCGYGCQIHHLVYCFILAYGTERTLILDSRGWRYSSGGWDKVFLPVSNTCTDRTGQKSRPWGSLGAMRDVPVVELPIVDSLHPRPPHMPLAIPEDLAPRLMRLHGNPAAWWIGQFLRFLLKPQPHLQRDIDSTTTRMGFQNPIVGVHVRRTDKVGTEAAFHSIDEYMHHVIEWFTLYEKIQPPSEKTNPPPRRVYLATDEPSLLAEAKKKFPEYTFISDNDFSRSAGLGTRYSDASLRGIVLDVHFLSRCDYLVCTFSSQVCRLAYEIMQTLHADASSRFTSLDDIFYFGGQNAHNQEVVAAHAPRTRSEIELKPGDAVGIAGNHWDGYSKGLNRRTGKSGLYPSYKVKETIDIASFPTYPQVPLKNQQDKR